MFRCHDNARALSARYISRSKPQVWTSERRVGAHRSVGHALVLRCDAGESGVQRLHPAERTDAAMPDLTVAELGIPTEQIYDPAKPLVLPVNSPVVASTRHFIPWSTASNPGILNLPAPPPEMQAAWVQIAQWAARRTHCMDVDRAESGVSRM